MSASRAPVGASSQVKKARLLYQKGRLEEARTVLESLWRLSPENIRLVRKPLLELYDRLQAQEPPPTSFREIAANRRALADFSTQLVVLQKVDVSVQTVPNFRQILHKKRQNLRVRSRGLGIKPMPEGATTPQVRRIRSRATITTQLVGAIQAKERVIELTPHLDTRIISDIDIEIGIYLDQLDFRPGETGSKVEASIGTTVQVTLLVTEHFKIVGSDRLSFKVEDRDRIDLAPFKIQRVDAPAASAEPAVVAMFSVAGRPSGIVARLLTANGEAKTENEQVADRLQLLQAHSLMPDLTVVVTEHPGQEGQQFWCTVHSPHLEEFSKGKSEPWNLPAKSEAIVTGIMNALTGSISGPAQLLTELRGAGSDLFKAAPEVFRRAYWELSDRGLALQTISVVSQEPYMPWELMVPHRDSQRDDALGTRIAIGRWLGTSSSSLGNGLRDATVIAPSYSGGDVLEKSQAEADLVASLFSAQVIRPARYGDVAAALASGRSLIHFVCHGKDEGVAGQRIDLDEGEYISARSLAGMYEVAETFSKLRPIVFLNACEIGRGNPTLMGPGGFAARFIELGAAAVIAPIWSVEDTVAHEIAVEFYEQVRSNPKTPMARIFANIRARAYDASHGKDTYAAYCFYGDPQAVAAIGDK